MSCTSVAAALFLFRCAARLTTPAGSGPEVGASTGALRRLLVPGALSCIFDLTKAVGPWAERADDDSLCCRDLRAEQLLTARSDSASKALSLIRMILIYFY